MNVVDIIKYEVSESEIVGKYDSHEIKLGSQLSVYPGQTAFFVKGGKILDEFTSGTYTLTTENIPLLGKLINAPFGGDTPFQAEVWFVNQVSLLDCKWGTISPIQIEDPKYGVIVPIRGYGQYGFHISEPRKFLERFVGNMPSFAVQKLTDYFRGVILSKLTNIISDKLTKDNLSVVNINSNVEEISAFAQQCLEKTFASYGVCLELFNAIAINVDENDVSFKKLKEAKDAAAKINIIGRENYQLQRSFDVLENAARNTGGGGINAAVGIGAGLGIGGQIGSMVANTINTNPTSVPPIPQSIYYLAIDGKSLGPMSYEDIKGKLTAGEINVNTLVWKQGMKSWAAISTVDDFTSLTLGNCPPPLPTI